MSEDVGEHSRRIAREIAIFEAHESVHRNGAVMDWRNASFLLPAIRQVFGRDRIHDIYAESIAAAIARSGRDTVFSLGCGDGEQEIMVLQRADALGLQPFRIVGLELAPAVAERANAAAAAAGLADRLVVVVRDLNDGLPGDEPVAAVMAHHTLHHIVELEALFDDVARRLHAGGVLVTFDMIGRNGHMRWPEVRPLIRALWAMLPPEKRYDHVFGRPMPQYQDWDCAVDGFEGVRAQDILGLIAARFQPARFFGWGAFAEVFLNERCGPNFDPDVPADRDFLTRISMLQDRLLAERRTTPTEMAAELRPRHGGFTPDPDTAARFRSALRAPGEVFAPIVETGFESPYPPPPQPSLPRLRLGRRYPLFVGGPVSAALEEGWLEPAGLPAPVTLRERVRRLMGLSPHINGAVWALLDEQALSFQGNRPARSVRLQLWNNLPASMGPAVRAEAEGCLPAETGPLAAEETAELVLTSADGPRREWHIRLYSAAYRCPHLDGQADQRPLSYILASITPEA